MVPNLRNLPVLVLFPLVQGLPFQMQSAGFLFDFLHASTGFLFDFMFTGTQFLVRFDLLPMPLLTRLPSP